MTFRTAATHSRTERHIAGRRHHCVEHSDEHHALADLLTGLAPQRREAYLLAQVACLSYAEAGDL